MGLAIELSPAVSSVGYGLKYGIDKLVFPITQIESSEEKEGPSIKAAKQMI